MQNRFESRHNSDEHGMPTGGSTAGVGFLISWQNGPLGSHVFGPGGCRDQQRTGCGPGCAEGCTRKWPNGAFVEDLLEAVKDRIAYYQSSPFACDSNQRAIAHIDKALEALHERTRDRERRQVEGTHQV